MKICCVNPEMTYEKLTTLTPFAPALTDGQAAEQVEFGVKPRRLYRASKDEINSCVTRTPCYQRRGLPQVSGLSNEVIAKLNDHKRPHPVRLRVFLASRLRPSPFCWCG
ncbi:hypothetical protein MJ581_21840 [Escherichia coli]|nr:hypothetical protein MJ581_21840 [Escherichia coli]